jgi:hypothetical protein
MHVEGACHCGRITFTAEVDPSKAVICHCTDCQVLSGSPFRAVVPAPLETFVLHGEPKYYTKVADSGNRRNQAFCPECATPLFGIAPEAPIVTVTNGTEPTSANFLAIASTGVTLRIGCLKQRNQLAPTAQIWQRSALGWVGGLTDLPASPDQRPPAAASATR